GVPVAELRLALFSQQGQSAAKHVFSVAASLDSQVVGEPQVLGQVKENYRQALATSATGPLLNALFPAAFAAAARVRSETSLAERPVTIVSSALQVARQLHGDLSQTRVLLIGLGEMCEMLAADFQQADVAEIVVSHESQARAEAAARRLSCHYMPFEALPSALTRADILVSDRGAGRWTVTQKMVEEALKVRRNRPIFLIDAAIPADIEASVGDLADAFLYDLHDLESLARQGRSSRQSAVDNAQQLLNEELGAFVRHHSARDADPILADLHGHFERIRQEILQDTKLDREAATRLLVKRLLYEPSRRLRDDLASRGSTCQPRSETETSTNKTTPLSLAEAVRQLFLLEAGEEQDNQKKDRPKEES
ncbi:MAG: glutamyl-tRNA reductase, partial [Pseudomonadota bacterium]